MITRWIIFNLKIENRVIENLPFEPQHIFRCIPRNSGARKVAPLVEIWRAGTHAAVMDSRCHLNM